MDVNKLAEEAAKDERVAIVTIFQRDGTAYLAADGSEATISVLGSESKKYRAAKDATQRKMMKTRAIKLEPEDLRRNRIELASAATVDWHGWEASGVALPFSTEAVKALLRNEHVLEQVETAIAAHADFFTENSSS